MRSFSVVLALISAVAAAPSLVARAPVPLGEVCTDINFGGSCVVFEAAAPFTAGHPSGCAANTAPFIKSISSARGLTDGYTCFLYSESNCQGTRLVISGQIPDFRAASVNFNDKALSWSCDSALTKV
ncbi:hypothetical protein C8J56DRAFT_880677 [Mycena floridula]|nr:hypothetical protein C8J56DRAFT_880677 [Mycena floridula]